MAEFPMLTVYSGCVTEWDFFSFSFFFPIPSKKKKKVTVGYFLNFINWFTVCINPVMAVSSDHATLLCAIAAEQHLQLAGGPTTAKFRDLRKHL